MRERIAVTVVLIAVCVLAVHLLTNAGYGFHRDELQTLDDARQMEWGYVAYPPVTPALARVQMEVFGTTPWGVRVLPAMAGGIVIVLTGLMAREMGGGKFAQMLAALGVAVAPVALASGALLQYVAFDFLWWVLISYFVVKLIATSDERWWVAIGATIGLGMMTKYTMGIYVLGVLVGVVLSVPPYRSKGGSAKGGATLRYSVIANIAGWLRSKWLWAGVALSIAIFLPNAIWQARHGFISLEFLQYIHARDVRIGRTNGFLLDQLKTGANLFTVPLWMAGLVALFRDEKLKRYRMLAWMYVIPLALFVVAKGRGYYMAPAYAMLLAAGAVVWERWLGWRSEKSRRVWQVTTVSALVIGGVLMGAMVLPIAPVNSKWWQVASKVDGDLPEEIGWQELVQEVARIRDTLPESERAGVGILAGNYGEAGAVNVYGKQYGLPKAISGTNSGWLRGYGERGPERLIVLGFSREGAEKRFEACELAGHITNRYGVRNEESEDHPDIFFCGAPRAGWKEFWSGFKRFG